MRVIAGSARHLKLKTIEGMGTRPTTDRIKETLFNMLFMWRRAGFLICSAEAAALELKH